MSALLAIAAVTPQYLYAGNHYWDGKSGNINANSNWVMPPGKPSDSDQTAIWNFNTASVAPSLIDVNNLDLAGFHYSNNVTFSISANRDYEIYGFYDSGTATTYAIWNDTANTQTLTNTATIKFLSTANPLTIETGSGRIVFNASLEFSNSSQTTVTGSGGVTMSKSVNINGKNFTFSNSGTNTVSSSFNSANLLTFDGGGTTTFNGDVTNTTSTTVSNFSVVHFNGVVNSNKLTIESGAKVYMGGNATHNSGIDLKCGTLLLKKSNVIGNYTINAMGGIFNLQGYSEGLQGLTLTKNSTIDFGSASGANSLDFGNTGSFTSGAYLTILNWQSGDTLKIGNLGSTRAQQVLFYGDYGSGVGFYTAVYNNGSHILTPGSLSTIDPGAINCVPVPVPEPSTYLMGGALMLALGAYEVQRRKRLNNQRQSLAHDC
ncbi:hypothetical protein [Cerasicoccus frondis]|uniref:hypothetical protein n=1 Tax=Cerasicoccus frondis TaxID=490090 RepID=UPI002852A074|nr:hypothetical protein [Cerasicoccus frondis]